MSTYRIGSLMCTIARRACQKNIKTAHLHRCRNFATASQNKPKEASTFKLALIGAGFGAAAGTAYSLYDKWTDNVTSHIIHEKKPARILDELPKVKITKRIVNPKDTSGLEIVMFQFQTCPFCCKVRAFLDFMGLSYSVIEVDAVLRQDLKWSDYKKVPMLLVKRKDGKYVQLTDSSTIISVIATYLHDKSQDVGEIASFYPNVTFFDDKGIKVSDIMNKYFLMYQDNVPKNVSKDQMQEERKWRNWADSHLVHLISPNVYQTRDEAFETFEWFSDAGEWDVYFPKWERDMMVYVGATAMWLISKRLKKRHGLTDDVRSHIYDALNYWTSELERKKIKFMGGKQPNLADLAVFGVLSSMEGCQAFKDCLNNTKIGTWFYAVKDIVVKNRGQVVRENINQKVMQPNIA